MSNLGIFIAGCFVGSMAGAAMLALMQAAGRSDNRIENWEQRKTVVNKSRIEG